MACKVAALETTHHLQSQRLPRQLENEGRAGDEFYLKEWPQVEGYTFREVLVSFSSATPIGVKEAATGAVLLNPEDNYVIQPGTLQPDPRTLPLKLLAGSTVRAFLHCRHVGQNWRAKGRCFCARVD